MITEHMKRHPLTEYQQQQVLDMWHDGKCYFTIADVVYNRSRTRTDMRTAIYHYLIHMGIEKKLISDRRNATRLYSKPAPAGCCKKCHIGGWNEGYHLDHDGICFACKNDSARNLPEFFGYSNWSMNATIKGLGKNKGKNE